MESDRISLLFGDSTHLTPPPTASPVLGLGHRASCLWDRSPGSEEAAPLLWFLPSSSDAEGTLCPEQPWNHQV